MLELLDSVTVDGNSLLNRLQLFDTLRIVRRHKSHQLLGLRCDLLIGHILVVFGVLQDLVILAYLQGPLGQDGLESGQFNLHRDHTVVLVLKHPVYGVRVQVQSLLPLEEGVLLQVPRLYLLLHLPVLLLELPHLGSDIVVLLFELVYGTLQQIVLLP